MTDAVAERDERTAIAFEDVSVKFTDVEGREILAVDQVSFTIQRGSLTSVIGPSGCGKTTLLRMLAGLHQPTSGNAICDGRVIRELNQDVGYISQDSNLYPWMTVRRNIEFPLALRGVPQSERKKRSDEYIALIGLKGFENHYPYQLSGGMQKRVSVARTLIYEPRIILMDEPFSALDAQTRMALQSDIQRMWQEREQTIMLVTHDLTEAIALSDTIVTMSHRPGRIIQVFDVPFKRPRNIFDIQAIEGFGEVYETVWQPLRGEVLATTASSVQGPSVGVIENQDGLPPGRTGGNSVSVMHSSFRKLFPRNLERTPISVTLWRFALVVLVLALWELLSDTKVLQPLVFSHPLGIADRVYVMLRNSPVRGVKIYRQIEVTLSEFASGFGIGCSIAIFLGFLLGRSRYLAELFRPLILLFHGLPIVAIAPLFLIVLGLGYDSKVAVSLLTSFFGSFFVIYSGVNAIPEEQVRLARLMSASRWQVVRSVILPASLPFVFTGLRVAVPLGMTGAIIGEFVASSAGLGWFIISSAATLDSPDLFAALVILMVMVYGIGLIVGYGEKKALRWQPRRAIGNTNRAN